MIPKAGSENRQFIRQPWVQTRNSALGEWLHKQSADLFARKALMQAAENDPKTRGNAEPGVYGEGTPEAPHETPGEQPTCTMERCYNSVGLRETRFYSVNDRGTLFRDIFSFPTVAVRSIRLLCYGTF